MPEDGRSIPSPEAYSLLIRLMEPSEFIAGRNEYTVNVALVAGDIPLLGIISAPALGTLWRGVVRAAVLKRLTLRDGV